MLLVPDTSVVIKWFVEEPGTEAAARWLEAASALAVPDLLFAELANVLWKKVSRQQLSPAQARNIRGEIEARQFDVRSVRALAAPALDLAIATGRSAYDCLYLALAIVEDAPLVTADLKFFNALAPTRLGARLRFVDSEPS